MAGHSKWANIKHRKGKADAAKGKIFTRVAKEIINAVKLGGPDAKMNPRLRLALQKAKAANVPNDNIERCIKKASSTDQEAYHEMHYELYGYGGVGIIAEIMTDNKNRIASDIRIATNKCGGTIAHPGSVVFNFDHKGIIRVSRHQAVEDELFLAVSEAGAEDFVAEDEDFVIVTDPTDFDKVKEAITALGVEKMDANLEFVPKTYMDCNVETAKQNIALLEWLDGIDDVDTVYHNMKVPEELANSDEE
ncbi:MAG: YebC/PmpR family DNA-binding transcriptional regulator [Chlamydiales bacterium]|nr:YebC/PmpR family DNA-binding transcriptional regulator [Chlamydiales bacterium]